jgi:hypothetical protein
VPAITNLVFVRRVNSRILYDQMIGRATRRCDEIGKEYFRKITERCPAPASRKLCTGVIASSLNNLSFAPSS